MIGAEDIKPDDGVAAGRDLVIGIVVAALATAALIWLIPAQISREATGNDVAPAFIPQLAASVVLGLSMLLVGHRLWSLRPVWGHGAARRLAIEIGLLACAAVLTWLSLSTLGFLPTAAMLIIAGGILARHRPFWWLIPLALVFPVLVELGAWRIFLVDLP